MPTSDRDRAFVTIHTLVLHLRPVKVPARAIPFTHTWGLGGSSLVLIALLAVTGILLMLGYQPAPGAAYASVLAIERDVTFGPLVRGIHYWAAHLLVIVVVLHMARVLLTGGYHGPRQFNWVVGASLLGLVLFSAFTGYLLPWDQLSYWAITISTGMLGYVPLAGDSLQRVARGGAEIGVDTLVLFYTVHTSIVPAALLAVMSLHFWRVRKAGGVVVPAEPDSAAPGDGGKVMFIPHLLAREASLALVVTAAVTVLGAAFGAPLGEPANPGMSPNPAKAPWYFMGFQELLVHVHPVVAILIVPLAATLALIALPYVTRDDEPAGTWWLSASGKRAAGIAALAAGIITPLAIVLHDVAGRMWPGGTTWMTGAVLPMAVVGGGGLVAIRLLRARLNLSRNEVAQTVAVACGVVFLWLTIVGVWFRGPGMALVWPWAR
ncbi:MAG: cytochrome b N-terminal domain-containing protein [Vicinamibacterales bacterium]|nr:cytochrome b N-terminal domain-containing protein [Vicinamibacterales bacterium]